MNHKTSSGVDGTANSEAKTPSGGNSQSKKRSRPINDSFLRNASSVRQAQLPMTPGMPTLFAAAAPVNPDASRKLSAAAKEVASKRKVQPLHGAAAGAVHAKQSQPPGAIVPATEQQSESSQAKDGADADGTSHVQQIWRKRRSDVVDRCFSFVQKVAATNEAILLRGDQLAICMRVVMDGAAGDLRHRVLAAFDHLMVAWQGVVAQQLERALQASEVAPEDILAVVQAIHSVERCGRPFAKKRLLQTLLEQSRFSAQDYFQWDPHAGPPALEDDPGALRKFTNALVYSYSAEFVGVDIGCPYTDVFRQLPSFRPYRSVLSFPRECYVDQLNLIYHVVMTSSGWGKSQLLRELFPHEWAFLKVQLPILVQIRDTNLAAKCVRALRLFRATDDEPVMQQGMRLLMSHAMPDGPIGLAASQDEEVTCAVLILEAMSDCGTTGFGPVIPGVVDLLLEWVQADISKLEVYRQDVIESQRLYLEHQQKDEEADKIDAPFGSDITSDDLKELMKNFRTQISHDFIELGSYLSRSSTAGQMKSILRELAKQEVTLDQLLSTRVARQVNKLSSHPDVEVAALASQITAKWKAVVAQSAQRGV